MIGLARFDNGKGLLEELVADGNQGYFPVLAFGHQPLLERLAGRILLLRGQAAPIAFAPDQPAPHFSNARLPPHTGASSSPSRGEAREGDELAVIIKALETTSKQ